MAATVTLRDSLGKVVLPGDEVFQLPDQGQIRVGPGIQQQGNILIASRPGVVRSSKGGKIWLDSRQRRYTPAAGEAVIGIVMNRMGESFTVDINGPSPASLPLLAFEGATRRNRPNLKAGDLVYARLVVASRDMDPELACMDAQGAAAGFGPLEGGYQINVTTSYARQLLGKPPPAVLKALGASLQFEAVIGQNGRVWIKSPDCVTTITVANAISETELLTEAQSTVFAKSFLNNLTTLQAAAPKA